MVIIIKNKTLDVVAVNYPWCLYQSSLNIIEMCPIIIIMKSFVKLNFIPSKRQQITCSNTEVKIDIN